MSDTKPTLEQLEAEGKAIRFDPNIEFDGSVLFVQCEACGNEQGWMGDNIQCEECDELMPSVKDYVDV